MTAIERFYVTVKDGARTGWLCGPYETKAEAERKVARGRELACDADAWAHFYAYGVTKVTGAKVARTVFGRPRREGAAA